MYDCSAVERPCRFSEEKREEFAALASAGVVEKLLERLDWHGPLPLLAGSVPQYGEYAVISPVRYFEGSQKEGSAPGMEFLFEVRTAYPEEVRQEMCRCCAALRTGSAGDDGEWQFFIADPEEGMSVTSSGVFTEFKVRIKLLAIAGKIGNLNPEQRNFLPEADPQWLFRAIAEYKGFAVGGAEGIRHKCRRAELIRSEYFPLSGYQRLTLHLVSVMPGKCVEAENIVQGGWEHHPLPGGRIKCIHEGIGSKCTFSQKHEGGRVWWKKSIYAEYIIDLAESEVKGEFPAENADFLQMEQELDLLIAETMIAGREFTGANIPDGEGGLIVRFDGTSADGAEFSVSGLFAERITAVKSLSLLTSALDCCGKWSIRESSVSMENASGKMCWQLYMSLLM